MPSNLSKFVSSLVKTSFKFHRIVLLGDVRFGASLASDIGNDRTDMKWPRPASKSSPISNLSF